MPWLGNGSRERLWDLPGAVAEGAQLSHPRDEFLTPSHAVLSQNQPWFQTWKSSVLVVLYKQGSRAEFNCCFDLENVGPYSEIWAVTFGKSAFSELLLFPVGPRSSSGNHRCPAHWRVPARISAVLWIEAIQLQGSGVSKGALTLPFQRQRVRLLPSSVPLLPRGRGEGGRASQQFGLCADKRS